MGRSCAQISEILVSESFPWLQMHKDAVSGEYQCERQDSLMVAILKGTFLEGLIGPEEILILWKNILDFCSGQNSD